MEPHSKKHKRSGSTSGKVVSTYRKPKTSLNGKLYGKFQAGLKVKPEKKNIDVDLTGTITTLPTLATVLRVLLNPYTAGTGANNALGRRVLNRSLLLRMMIAQSTVTGVTTVGPTGCRVVVVYDKEANGTLAQATDIFQSATANSCALMNLDNSERFTVLLDEKFSFGQVVITGAPVAAVSAPTTYVVDRYIKLRLDSIAKTTFNGAIGNILTGSIVLIAFSDTPAASNPPVLIGGQSRIRFSDG